MVDFNIETVKDAYSLLSNIIRKTSLNKSPYLSGKNEIYIKLENLQLTGSFKLRGAYYKISKLSDSDKEKGVIACSAGNHAQGVALAAHKNNIKSTIFIPATAPLSKIEATKSYGAEIRLIDGVYDDAYVEAAKYQNETGSKFIHPFDDLEVISGQGTIALEILEQLSDVDAVVVPIGGGGLISGVAAVIKTLKPDCKVYGVQAENAASMYESIKNKERTKLNLVNTFADGTAVKYPGELTFELCNKYVDEIFTVSESEIASAILALMEKEKTVAEGAGALPVAACMFDKIPLKNKKIVCIISGGNIDFKILSNVLTRALLKNGRFSNMTVDLLDQPGELNKLTSAILGTGANILEIVRNYTLKDIPLNKCSLNVMLETRNKEHLEELKKTLQINGFNATFDS